jgi:hypothetical protein
VVLIVAVLQPFVLAVCLLPCMLMSLFCWCRSNADAITSLYATRDFEDPVCCRLLVLSRSVGWLLLFCWRQHEAGIPVHAQQKGSSQTMEMGGLLCACKLSR